MKYTLKHCDTTGKTTDVEFSGSVKELEKEIARLESDGSVVFKIVREDGREFFKIAISQK